MQSTVKYTFSGHESFPCKSMWLKKGYEFVKAGNDFNSPDAVVSLGVGKNMVASIRFWLRAFGLTDNDQLTPIAHYIFDSQNGCDPYLEDLGTLWLLHTLLTAKGESSIYNIVFTSLQRERKSFDRQTVVNYIKRRMSEDNKLHLFNENTVKKDVGVFLQNYTVPSKVDSFEDYSALLIDLELIRVNEGGKAYTFNLEGKRAIPKEFFLYAIIISKGNDNTVGYDLLQTIGLAMCMNDMEVIEMCQNLQDEFPNIIRYSDTAGIRQIQFIGKIHPTDILDKYYNK